MNSRELITELFKDRKLKSEKRYEDEERIIHFFFENGLPVEAHATYREFGKEKQQGVVIRAYDSAGNLRLSKFYGGVSLE